MRLRVLGCAGGSAPGMPLSCYLVDDVVAVDAGALTTGLAVEQQRRVRTVLVTHGHLDHVWTLPLFLANRFGPGAGTLGIHASAYTLETIRRHLFNDRIWPDFTGARIDDVPLVRFHPVEPGDRRTLETGHEVTAVPLAHVVPCQAYLLRHDGRSLLVCGDTTTTDEVWRFANAQADLAGLVVECSFTDDLLDLARRSRHMTPSLLLADLKKLKRDVPVHVTHLKPGYGDGIREALEAGGDKRLSFLEPGQELTV
jgi:cAMP phosphodiesterase